MALSVRRGALRSYIERSLQELPALPPVINRILQITEDPHTSAQDLERVLAHEPALVAKMLRVVNSAYYGLASQVSSISHAVTILGFHQVRNLALSVAAFALVRSNQPGLAKLQRAFWRHSFGVGLAAPEIVTQKKGQLSQRDEAQVGGLLHDLGALFLFSSFSEHYREAVERANREQISLPAAEIAQLGIAHDEVGGMIARMWNFPESLCSIIEHHHDWTFAEGNLTMAAVQSANHLVSVAGYPLYPLPESPGSAEATAWLEMDDASREAFMDWIRARVDGAEQIFDIL